MASLWKRQSRYVTIAGHIVARDPLWAGVCWIMVKMLAVQIEAFCAAACLRPPLVCPRRVGSGGHWRVASAAAVSGATGSQNYEVTQRAVSLVGG